MSYVDNIFPVNSQMKFNSTCSGQDISHVCLFWLRSQAILLGIQRTIVVTRTWRLKCITKFPTTLAPTVSLFVIQKSVTLTSELCAITDPHFHKWESRPGLRGTNMHTSSHLLMSLTLDKVRETKWNVEPTHSSGATKWLWAWQARIH